MKKHCILTYCIPTKRKSGKNARRPAWMNKEPLDKFKHKQVDY